MGSGTRCIAASIREPPHLLGVVGALARKEDSRVLDAVLGVARSHGAANPNVDFALGALACVLKMPVGATEAIFATARTAGWLAHVLEEYGEAPSALPRTRRLHRLRKRLAEGEPSVAMRRRAQLLAHESDRPATPRWDERLAVDLLAFFPHEADVFAVAARRRQRNAPGRGTSFPQARAWAGASGNDVPSASKTTRSKVTLSPGGHVTSALNRSPLR